MEAVKSIKQVSIIYRMHPVIKPLIAISVAMIIYFIFPLYHSKDFSRIMLAWDVFSFCLLCIYWLIFYTSPATHIRKMAAVEDTSRVIIFVITLVCATASLLAVIILLTTKHESRAEKILAFFVAIIGMTLSWTLVHTIFAVRYAHMYYSDHDSKPGSHAAGLQFPDENKPDFVDFAYFSFVLGMTFQVSDVSITSRKIRRMVLWHSLISFGYNAVIIALTINVIAGLKE
jgi:uncharacterized membrane protein